MNTNDICHFRSNCSEKPLPVRLAPFPVDERAVYVHSVCAVLIDSRFGPGRSIEPFVVHLSEYPELELDVLCDLTNKTPIPSYLASTDSDSDSARRHMADAILVRTTCGSGWLNMRLQTSSPSTLGRGSPDPSAVGGRQWQSGTLIFENIWDA